RDRQRPRRPSGGAAPLRRTDAAATTRAATAVHTGTTRRDPGVRTCPRQPVLLHRNALATDREPPQRTGDRPRSGRSGPLSQASHDAPAEQSRTGTTAESPWPLRPVARKIGDWIHRPGAIWVEGQLTQIRARPGTRTAFLTLRDPSADVSMTVTCSPKLLQSVGPPLEEGSSVVLHAKPSYYLARGTLSLRADEIRAVGI